MDRHLRAMEEAPKKKDEDLLAKNELALKVRAL